MEGNSIRIAILISMRFSSACGLATEAAHCPSTLKVICLVPQDLARAEQAAQECDLLLAVGSTLSVYPVAGLVPLAKHSGAKIIIVNGEPTAMESLADAVLVGGIGDLLPSLIG